MFSGAGGVDFGDPEDEPPSSRAGCFVMLFVVGAVLAFAVFVGALALYPVLFVVRWPRLAATVQPWPVRAVVVLGMSAVGGLLYAARLYLRLYYGIFECCVGATMLWAAVSRPDVDRFVLGLGLMGGIYVIVRGLDNVAQAKAPKEVRIGRLLVSERGGKLVATDATDGRAPAFEVQTAPLTEKGASPARR